MTVAGGEYFLEGKAWQEMDRGSMHVPAGSWEVLKNYVLKTCSEKKSCSLGLESPKAVE